MIRPLDEILDPLKFGNKASNLSILVTNGFRVPKGIAISFEEFDYYLKHSSLRNSLFGNINLFLESYSGNFAVRSSSSIEDSFGRSYAGLFKSVLDVSRKDIFMAINLIFSHAKGLLDSYDFSFKLGIIIQEMIYPDLSGVLFTYDIINNTNRSVVVELLPGNCENVVSGKENPLLLIIDKSSYSIMDRMGNEFSFDKSFIPDLIENTNKIESIFNYLQHIEFSVVEDTNYFLQTRPLTGF